MKKIVLAFVLVFIFTGCSGILMNHEYSQLLDRTAAWSKIAADQVSNMTDVEKALALRINANAWKRFQDARDGKDSSP